jgi:hypothetical protein
MSNQLKALISLGIFTFMGVLDGTIVKMALTKYNVLVKLKTPYYFRLVVRHFYMIY